jgi:hypothetical protein
VANDDYALRKRQIIESRPRAYLLDGLDVAPLEMEVALAGADDTIDDASIDVNSHPSDDADYLVEASCRAAAGIPLSVAVAAVERALITDFKGWGNLEAHRWTVTDEQAVFEGVWLPRSGAYLTCRVTIDR